MQNSPQVIPFRPAPKAKRFAPGEAELLAAISSSLQSAGELSSAAKAAEIEDSVKLEFMLGIKTIVAETFSLYLLLIDKGSLSDPLRQRVLAIIKEINEAGSEFDHRSTKIAPPFGS